MKYILHIATIISIITYMLWDFLPKGSFYIGNGLFIFLLCVYIFSEDRKSFIKFVLFSLSLNNLFDELFFNPTKLGINESLLFVFIIVIGFFKYRRNARKICKQ